MAEGFGRWESDPLFSAAEVVQDSADRMELIYRLLLHEQKLLEGKTSDSKILNSILFHKRDLLTALETTKWQLEDFEGAVRFAALTNTSNSRAHAISNHHQFIRAIGEQIVQVGKSLENMSIGGLDGNQSSMNLNEPEVNGLTLFLSGSDHVDQHLQYDTENNLGRGCCDLTSISDEIVEIEPECERLSDHPEPHDVEVGDVGYSNIRYFSVTKGLSGSVLRFLRNLWFMKINKLSRTSTKRRKDGESTNGFILDNDHPLSSGFSVTPVEQVYTWIDALKRRFEKSFQFHQYGRRRVWILISSLVFAVAIVGFLAIHS